MRDETAKDNRETAALISHDLTRNNELSFSSTTNLKFYRFQKPKLLFLYFSLFKINIPEIFSGVHGFTGKTIIANLSSICIGGLHRK